MNKNVVFIDRFSEGLDDLTQKQQRCMTTVLKQLSEMKRFSVFEATANDHIARMMDKLVKEKYIEVDNSMGYPWSGVKLTQKGLEHIAEKS